MISETLDPFRKLLRILAGRKIKSVCIEAGHIYRDQKPNEEHFQGFSVGSDICCRLLVAGIKPYRMVFIDDYNPEKDIFCLRGYLSVARGHDFEPHEIVWESSLEEEARAIVDRLLSRELAIKNGEGVFTAKGHVRLQFPNGRLSCCVLDAALYLRRFARHDFSITVLPRNSRQSYKDQQKGVRRILRLLGHEQLPMANVFFGENNEITVGLP